jgi:hypothetical protein
MEIEKRVGYVVLNVMYAYAEKFVFLFCKYLERILSE